MAKIATIQNQKRNTPRRATQSEQAEIEKLAYQFFVERGYQHGFDHEDWIRAEAIVRSRRS